MQRLMTIPMIASLMLSPAAVLAQSATETGAETTATASSFNELSPGNKMIARSLMDAQTLPADGTTQPWSLDDITAARSETGWGNVFKQMQADGVIEARNLGEVVSAHARATHRPITESVAAEAGLPPEAAVSEAPADGDVAGEPAATEVPADVDGSFESLSPGNKKIARSLMDAQTLPGDGSAEAWSLDRIAAAKGETGWGNVFKQMQAEGLVETRNLGQAVSQHQHDTLAVTTGTGAATATAPVTADRLPEQANGQAAGPADKGSITAAARDNSGNAAGITTAAGASANAHGLSKRPVSASGDITTASGATIGGGATASSGSVSAAASNSSQAAATTAGSTSAASNSAAATTAAGGGNGQGHAYGRSR